MFQNHVSLNIDEVDLLKTENVQKFFPVKEICWNNFLITFLESFSMFMIFVFALFQLQFITVLSYLFTSVRNSAYSLLSFILIFTFMLFGLAICQISLFGNQYLRYSDISGAMMYTLYSPIFLKLENYSNQTGLSLIFRAYNFLLYYIFFVYILLGVITALMYDSYR
jgi:hypothetical protein